MLRRTGASLLVVVLGCLLAAAAAAQPAADDGAFSSADFDLADPAFLAFTDTITVLGPAVSASPFPVGDATVTVVDLDRPGAPGDLAELLTGIAGLQVRRYGGLGAEAVPSIRGSTSAQVQVLVDGLPLADAQDGGVDLSRLPLARYAQAEIYRGYVPARFGGGSGAGAVNLVTRRGAAGGGLRLGAGSFGEASARWEQALAPGGGAVDVDLLLHARRTDNAFGFRDHNQTFANPDDDRDAVRRNAGWREHGGSLSGSWHGPALLARWRLNALRREGGRPGPVGAFESPHAALRRDGSDLRLTLSDPRERLGLDLFAGREDERLEDRLREVGWDPAGVTTSRSEQLYGRLTWRGGRSAGEGAELRWRLSADGRRQWYDESVPGLSDPLRTRTTLEGAAVLEVLLYAPRLTLRPQWRWSRLEDDFPALPALPWLPPPPLAAPHVHRAASPVLGATWEARPGTLFFEGHVGTSLREPGWIELFGQRGGVQGNRELVPEEIRSRDLSAQLRPTPDLHLRLAWFRTEVQRAILWRTTSQYTSQAFNAGATSTSGLELEAAVGRAQGLRLQGNLTVQDTRDRGGDPVYSGKDLPYLPEFESALEAALPLGPWRLGLSWQHQAAAYRDRYNSAADRIPARSLWNVSVARDWRQAGRALTASLEIVNLTDADVYDVAGFPLPGRSFRAGLNIE
ncbi:MAG: TonB-dependent receptor [bacterium]|nr:TonB-dependent receptor [bacterium]